jgi:membrane fusion protein, multidrug efflux system
MSKRTAIAGLIFLAAALAVFVFLKWMKPSAAEEEAEAAPDMAVHAGTIVRATLHQYVTAYGNIEPAPAENGKAPGGAVVSAPVAGVLAAIDCAEGKRAFRGDVLFRLDSRLADVAVLKARQELDSAKQIYDRQEKLLKAGGTSEKSFQEAERQANAAKSDLAAAEAQLELLRVRAPIAGTVIRLAARLGRMVDPATVLCEIISGEKLTAALRVPSREAVLLKTGQTVEFEGDEKRPGTLTYVGRDIDPATDTVPARAALPAGADYHSGQFISTRILCLEHRDCLTVPEAAVITESGGNGTLVLIEGDHAVRKPVTLGLRDEGLIEVGGPDVKEGLAIVTVDAYAVPDQTKIHLLKPAP